jgi:MscS family membrane protein
MNAITNRIAMLVRCSLCLTILFLCFFWINGAEAATDLHPLAPPDTSSPGATLKTFLDTGKEAIEAYKAGRKDEAIALAQRAAQCLNLEKEPPALRDVIGFYTSLYLKETLDRIEIPPYNEIPDAQTVRTEKISRWTVPYTEITIALVKDAFSNEQFLFTTETVRNAETYYEKVKNLPYKAQSGDGAFLDRLKTSGSLVISKAFIQRLPHWMKSEVYDQAVWQWIGLILYFCIAAGILAILYKYGGVALGVMDKKVDWNLRHIIGGLILPVTVILLSKIGLWFMVYGLHFLNADTYLPIAFVFLIISYAGWIWLIAAVCNRLSEAFVSAGGFVPEGMDAQLIRLGFQIVAVIIIGVVAIYLGARLGLPTYSLITGLGIGGLAVALAGREALSNIIGTVMIILDRPFKLGDYILLGGGERGEVTQVGLRSTRIRTRDDILISIPNSVIANEKMINESAPFSASRIRIKIGVAYGCDLTEVERILLQVAAQNEAVLSHPTPRIRFRRFGDSALDLELLCWIDPPELKGATIHQLNWAIYEEFRDKGIEIPFPQQDIHIRTST